MTDKIDELPQPTGRCEICGAKTDGLWCSYACAAKGGPEIRAEVIFVKGFEDMHGKVYVEESPNVHTTRPKGMDAPFIPFLRLNDYQEPNIIEETKSFIMKYNDHNLAPFEREIMRRLIRVVDRWQEDYDVALYGKPYPKPKEDK